MTHISEITAADDQTDADTVASSFVFLSTLSNSVLALPHVSLSPFQDLTHNSNSLHLHESQEVCCSSIHSGKTIFASYLYAPLLPLMSSVQRECAQSQNVFVVHRACLCTCVYAGV